MSRSIELFTPKQLAAETNLSYRLILDAIESGELACMKLSSRRWRIRSEAAAKWLAGCEQKHLRSPIET